MNASGASVNIYCPGGSIEKIPGMLIDVPRIKPKPNEEVHVQVVVDGNNYPFLLKSTSFSAGGRSNFASLHQLIDALTKNKSRSFVVEISEPENGGALLAPQRSTSSRFSSEVFEGLPGMKSQKRAKMQTPP